MGGDKIWVGIKYFIYLDTVAYIDLVTMPMVIPEHRFILIIIAKDGHGK
jgi:hypothetical protein